MKEEKDLEELEAGNVEASIVAAICKCCWAGGVMFALFHPEDSLLWLAPVIRDLVVLSGVRSLVLDQCEFGSTMKSSLRGVSNLPSFSSLSRRCSGGHIHETSWGRATLGMDRRERNPDYSKGFSEALAEMVASSVEWERKRRLKLADFVGDIGELEVDDTEELEEEEMTGAPPMPHPVGARGPPALSAWSDRRRWRRVVTLKWKRPEHINRLELRVLTLGVRHASRCPDRRGRRLLLLSDSLVAIGSLSKGRSTSAGLNQEIRRASAHILGTGTKVYARYIHTSRNCADGPSRGRKIGVVLKG